jgi:hypothetical protein
MKSRIEDDVYWKNCRFDNPKFVISINIGIVWHGEPFSPFFVCMIGGYWNLNLVLFTQAKILDRVSLVAQAGLNQDPPILCVL